MLDHITLRCTDVEKSKNFFSKALAPLGYKIILDKSTSVGFGKETADFWIKQFDGEIKPIGCIAFNAKNKEEVKGFYCAALEAGGKDNGVPGYRTKYHAGYYAAFVTGPDMHTIEAVYEE